MKSEDEALEDLLHAKSFDQLTGDEKKFVLRALGSAAEFDHLRQVEALLRERKAGDEMVSVPWVLTSLQKKIRTAHHRASVWEVVTQFRMPAYAAALLMLASAFVTKVLTRGEAQKAPIAEIIRTDTVIVSRVDTVWRVKSVYRYVNGPTHPAAVQHPVSKLSQQPGATARGVSMKEKEELEKLLVSGSDR